MADNEKKYDDNIQHGIDDNPEGDAKKGAALGGAGGALTGGIAGAAAGPVGAVVGAVVGGVVGAGASGAAVAGVDKIDNDNNVTGIGDKVKYDNDDDDRDMTNVDRTADFDSATRVETYEETTVRDRDFDRDNRE